MNTLTKAQELSIKHNDIYNSLTESEQLQMLYSENAAVEAIEIEMVSHFEEVFNLTTFENRLEAYELAGFSDKFLDIVRRRR